MELRSAPYSSAAAWTQDAERIAGFLPTQHEQLLSSQPEKYSEMVQSVSAYGIYLIDRRGVIQSWNRGAERITGYSRQDMVGQPYEALFPDALRRDGAPTRLLEFVRANRHCKEEQRRRLRNGSEFMAHAALDSVRAASGELLGFVEVIQDVTESKQREERLYQKATRDPMTGVANRGHFVEMAAQEIERARRFSEPLSMVMIDIDRFKSINDKYGHEIGDRVIVALTKTCAAHLRSIDLLGRVGGEEFAILMPRANKEPAAEMAQRLRLLVSEQRVPANGGREIGFTISLGLAALRHTTRDLAELMRNADAALYRAKREGRNRLDIWFE